MDGAIGKPSVDDEPAILWSVTVDPVGGPDVGFVGDGPVFISVSDSRFSHAIAQGNKRRKYRRSRPLGPVNPQKIIPPKKLRTDPPGCAQLIRENAKTHPALGECSTFPYYNRGDIWAKRTLLLFH
jgi:hypothetical protein